MTRLPKLIRWLVLCAFSMLLLMTAMRLALYFRFNQQGLRPGEVADAFWLGFRYDLRSVSLIFLPFLVLGSISPLNPFNRPLARRIWIFYFSLVAGIVVFFYIVDFAHYAYLFQRLNASVLNYLQDAGISASMVWQTYPVIWLLLGILVAVFAFNRVFRVSFRKIQLLPDKSGRRLRVFGFLAFFLLMGFLIFGRFNQYPLRWSDAFSLGNDYKANLALNPFESFFNTLKFRKNTINVDEVKKHYARMASFLGISPGKDVFPNFRRETPASDSHPSFRPNVVLVICESFSAYKSSMWGNPLQTTPFFDSLSRKGIFFDRCFTPAYGTARGVWATLTGTPDVEMPTTASRNPSIVDQHIILNEFSGYEKFYFIGGSPSWANIRGLLMNNIEGLHLYEESNLRSPKLDVWGISDKNLFQEAGQILSAQTRPFFAIIQTADNHRPYSIPEEDKNEFQTVDVPRDSLRKYGFESLAELNAFRYTDFCFRKFIDSIKTAPFFSNTLFVFVGDHGIPGNAGSLFPGAWTEQRLTCEHVPLLFYGPGWLPPSRISRISSQIDVMPTIAGICRISYSNATLGRDLLSPLSQQEAAFIFDPEFKQIGVVDPDYFYRLQLRTGKEELVPVRFGIPQTADAGKRDSLRTLSRAFYETARYLLFNNKKSENNDTIGGKP